MSEQTNVESSTPQAEPPRNCRGRGRGRVALVAIVLLLAGGLAGGLLSKAFAEEYGWHHFGFMHGPMSQAQINDRIDRMTKHLAIELDATPDQQARLAGTAKAAVNDLLPLREKAQTLRQQGIALLTAPTVDRAAVERVRSDQIALAETASKRIAQALEDASDVLSPEQRRKIADFIASFQDSPWARWHRG
jgi:periplasmic protein CpxP/Spy